MIDSEEKIHYIRNMKRSVNKLKKEIDEYFDKNRFLGWSKRKRKFVMKKYITKRKSTRYVKRFRQTRNH